jgi:hypothetical protein
MKPYRVSHNQTILQEATEGTEKIREKYAGTMQQETAKDRETSRIGVWCPAAQFNRIGALDGGDGNSNPSDLETANAR